MTAEQCERSVCSPQGFEMRPVNRINHPGEDAMVIYLELRPRKLSRQCTVYIYLMYLYIYTYCMGGKMLYTTRKKCFISYDLSMYCI